MGSRKLGLVSQLLLAGGTLSLIATAGSLFFSDVMNFVPCTLCWYQRIFMYPLVFLFFIAWLKDDNNVLTYTFPLSIIGWGISVFHLLVYFEVVPENITPCSAHNSCATVYIQWFGFVTIPMLSFSAFSLLLLLQYFIWRDQSEKMDYKI